MLKDRLWAGVGLAIGALYLGGPSTVPLDLWVAAGRVADAVVLVWVVAMAVLVIHPRYVPAHYLAATLSVLVYGGRGGGFAEMVLHDGRHDLVVAVAERFALAGQAALWHLRAVKTMDRDELNHLLVTYLQALGVRFEGDRPVGNDDAPPRR